MIEVTGLDERTDLPTAEVRNHLAMKIGKTVEERFPNANVDVRVYSLKARKGFWISGKDVVQSVQPNCDKNSVEYRALMVELIDTLHLHASTKRYLKDANIVLIGDLVKRTEIDLLKMRGFRRQQVNEIKKALAAKGLQLAG